MDLDIIKNKLESAFPGKLQWEESKDWPSAVIPPDQVSNIIHNMYHDAELEFRFLTDLTAVHYPERKGEELCVVYHLHSLRNNIRVRLKAYLPIAAPHIASIVSIFSGANWMERETYDFYGVNFEGHPDLRRILNVDEMDYFPMRKEYPMEDPTRMDKDDEMFGRGGSF